MAKANNILTSGEVAKICNVSIRTVCGWVDKGFLKGERISGGRNRRIPIGELVRFMAAHNMPMPKHWPALKKAAPSAQNAAGAQNSAAGPPKKPKPQYLLDPAQLIKQLQTLHGWQWQMLELLRKALPAKEKRPFDSAPPRSG